jgi:hypothetical protein
VKRVPPVAGFLTSLTVSRWGFGLGWACSLRR